MPAVGLDAVVTLFRALARYFAKAPSRLIRLASVDGLPGFVSMEGSNVLQTTALHIEDHKIVAIYVTRNPRKLRHLCGRESC